MNTRSGEATGNDLLSWACGRWLEEQKPIELRIIEAAERADAARRKADAARQEADKCAAALDVALGEVMRLEARREETSNARGKPRRQAAA